MKPIVLLGSVLLLCCCLVGNAFSRPDAAYPGQTRSALTGHFGGSAVAGAGTPVIASSESIRKPVKIGDRLSVLSSNGAEYSGRLREMSNDSLVIEERGKVIRSLSRNDIMEISLYRAGQGRAILVGSAVGSLAGLLVAAVISSPVNPSNWWQLLEGKEGTNYYSVCIPIGMVLGGVIGASSPVRVATWQQEGFWLKPLNSGQASAPHGSLRFGLVLRF